jgi:uncharacterized protein
METKTKKRVLIISLIVIILIVILYFFFFRNSSKDSYEFKGNTLSYSANRGNSNYEVLLKNSTGSLDIYKVRFKTRPFLDRSLEIYGLVFMPKNKSNVPGIVYLPGGGGTKDGVSPTAISISEMGYAVLVIDQRGVGETKGDYLSFDQDYSFFSQKKEPMQHLAVYDALKSFDVLREFPNVNKDNIAFIGESMGARYAIIAAAIEKRSKGFLGMSVSGFHIALNPIQPENDYLVSIDPDHYISSISPNQVIMIQGTNDSVVSMQDAQFTFSKAKDPKKFYIAQGCQHGYCEKMLPYIKEGLGMMFWN